MQPETIHILLIVGQYVLIPFALWSFRRFKASIVEDLKAHVDATMRAHEESESHVFEDLTARVGRIENVLLAGISLPKQRKRVAARRPSAASSSR